MMAMVIVILDPPTMAGVVRAMVAATNVGVIKAEPRVRATAMGSVEVTVLTVPAWHAVLPGDGLGAGKNPSNITAAAAANFVASI